MRVLHITNNFPTTNHPVFGVFVKEQIQSLENIGIENDLFFINGRENGKFEYIHSVFRLIKFLRDGKYNIIHCHHALSAICLILSRNHRRNKVILSFQNDPKHELGHHVFKFIKKRGLSTIFKNRSNYLSTDNSYYLPNGVNTFLFKPIKKDKARHILNLEQDKKYILFVSSNLLRKQKRYDRFKCVIELLKLNYGYDNLEELVLINTARDLIPLYYNAADVHLLTSEFEGSPNSVKECMSCNTPVVATNVGNIKDLFVDTKGCYLAADNDIETLTSLVDQAIRENFSNSRKKIIAMNLDLNSVAIKLKEIYINTIKS